MKFQITVERNMDTIDELFDNIQGKGIIGGMQKKVFKSVYLNKSYALFKMVKGLKFKSSDVVKDKKNLLVVEEKGTESFCKQEKKDLLEFLDGDYEQIKDLKEVKDWKTDRMINKILSKLKRAGKWIKDKSLKKALKDRSVRSFFLSAGITFEHKIIPG